jgi:hypothetical protein
MCVVLLLTPNRCPQSCNSIKRVLFNSILSLLLETMVKRNDS